MNPAISVIIPVYNALPFLPEAIESILNQTWTDFEFLLIDDGSTDGSTQYIESIEDPRARKFFQDHRGLVEVLNFGLSQARGELVARMDADDLALPHRLEKQIAFLQDHPEVVLLGTYVQEIDEHGKPIRAVQQEPTSHDKILSSFRGLHRWNPIAHPSVIYRKSAVLLCGGYRATFPLAQDLDLWRRLARVGRLHVLNQPLLLLRKHSQNVSLKRAAEAMESILGIQVYHRVWDVTGVDIVSEQPKIWHEARLLIHDLTEKLKLLESLEARVCLKQASWSGAKSFLSFISQLLRCPNLIQTLAYYRRHQYIVRVVSRRISKEVRNTCLKSF